MKTIKRMLVTLSLVLIFVSSAMAADTIKIGFLASLTGEGSTFGLEQVRGAEVAIDEINAAGGVNGKQLELIVYDDRGRQEDVIVSARRLIDEGIQVIGGANSSGMVMALAPILEKARVPLVSPFASNPAATFDVKKKKVRLFQITLGN